MGFVHLILLLLLEKTQEKSVAEVGKSREEFLGSSLLLLPRKKPLRHGDTLFFY